MHTIFIFHIAIYMHVWRYMMLIVNVVNCPYAKIIDDSDGENNWGETWEILFWKITDMFDCVNARINVQFLILESSLFNHAAKHLGAAVTRSYGLLFRKSWCWKVCSNIFRRIWYSWSYMEQWNEVNFVFACISN